MKGARFVRKLFLDPDPNVRGDYLEVTFHAGGALFSRPLESLPKKGIRRLGELLVQCSGLPALAAEANGVNP